MAAPPPLPRLAWLADEGLAAVQRTPLGTAPLAPEAASTLATPLGSVWKLFVYSYLSSNVVQEPVYRCAGAQRQTDEEYCCDPGASIGRDQALAQSCGPYFEPKRVGVSAADWTRYWRENDAPAWLLHLDALQPGTVVPVPELLAALRHIPAPARTAARQALQPVVVRDDAVLAALGGGPRFKTWSWHVGSQRAGGAAGWLADGTPFWFGSSGTSRSALHAEAGWMAQQWAASGLAAPVPDAAAVSAQPCIEVDYFQRYPIRAVERLGGGDKEGGAISALAGPLRGRYRITFQNGSLLAMEAVPAQMLRYGADGPRIAARLPLEDYVARVVDREGDARQTEAARALAIAARSYVLQNAPETEACRRIADDSRTQRVSPNPPSAAARAAAAFTEGLVVAGEPVRYHRDQASPGVMSWQAAVAAGRQGQGFATILRTAFPGGTLGPAQAGADCAPLPLAQQWLAERQYRWRQVLRAQAGYQPPGDTLRVCQLAMGVPHSDQRRLVIRVREWQSREGRVTLIHEYLHLAFRNHPHGQDETFIEQLAQQLADS
ncbi:MAG: DUF2300 domain-containing protein [Pseudomonadota bacterium]